MSIDELQDFNFPMSFDEFLASNENIEVHPPLVAAKRMKRFDKRITIRITSALLEQLQSAADLMNLSRSSVIKKSIASYLRYHQTIERPRIRSTSSNNKNNYEDQN